MTARKHEDSTTEPTVQTWRRIVGGERMSICKPCAIGADVVTAAMTGPLAAGDLEAVSFATRQHDYCWACPCQHNVQAQVTGKAVAR